MRGWVCLSCYHRRHSEPAQCSGGCRPRTPSQSRPAARHRPRTGALRPGCPGCTGGRTSQTQPQTPHIGSRPAGSGCARTPPVVPGCPPQSGWLRPSQLPGISVQTSLIPFITVLGKTSPFESFEWQVEMISVGYYSCLKQTLFFLQTKRDQINARQ